MIHFRFNDTEYSMYFSHPTLPTKMLEQGGMLRAGSSHRQEHMRCTRAVVQLANGEVVLKGLSICSPKDNFCRSKGRRVALKNAISASRGSLDRAVWDRIDSDSKCGPAFSRSMWQAYFEKCSDLRNDKTHEHEQLV